MTGGLSFIYDENNLFKNKINNQSVEIDKIMKKNLVKHQNYLLHLIKQHFEQTGSKKANKIIKNFNKEMHKFLIVKPKASNFDDLLALITSAA
jgi:glutamate synthase (NADPH/NADH) large chain